MKAGFIFRVRIPLNIRAFNLKRSGYYGTLLQTE